MNIPKLRFKDNNGNDYPQWEKKLIKDILKIYHGKDYKNEPNEKKLYPVLGTGGIITYIDKFLCDWECVLIGRKGTINKPQYMKTPFWSVDTLFYSKPKLKQNPKFQYYLFQNINWKIYDESTGVPSLSASTIEHINRFIPTYAEQEKIASFFSTIDKKIENLTNTITSLENQKKGLLQQIFSQKLRFKDENGNNYPNWKENIESIKILSGNMYPTTSYINKPGILLIQGINITPNKLLLNDCIYISNDYNEINHVIVKKGDILLGLNRPLINNQLKICLFDKDFAYLYQRAGILSFNKLKINSLFLYQYLQTDSFKKHLQVELVGSDQPYIKSNIFNKIKLIFPCLEEQTKIADFLSAFDRKLENQKTQLEHWKQIKKGLLQQMFV